MFIITKFNKISTSIEELYIIEPSVFKDERGYFMESYNKKSFYELGLEKDFVQDNHSKSKKGVLRGLHFQLKYPQEKLVRVIKGSIYDIAVDLRKDSPTFGQYFGIKLSEKNKKMIYIPEGFAHGFLALSDDTNVTYKVTEYYYEEFDNGIVWNDPSIKIQWPFKEYGINFPILSEKDKKLPLLNQIDPPFIYKKNNN